MKQHITIEQLNELTPLGWTRLRKWTGVNSGHEREIALLFTIGQMIEFLDDNRKGAWSVHNLPIQTSNDVDLGLYMVRNYDLAYRSKELCDALWEAVKGVLENEKVG